MMRMSRVIVVAAGLWMLAGAAQAEEATAKPAEAVKPARLLVVTVTTGFRHASINTAEPVLEELGRTNNLYHLDFLRMPPGRLPQPQAPKRAAGTSDDDWKQQEAAFKAAQEIFKAAELIWLQAVKEQFAKAFAPESLALFDGVIFASTTGELPIPDLALFLAWIKSGKAFIGFHAATDTRPLRRPSLEWWRSACVYRSRAGPPDRAHVARAVSLAG